TMSGWSSAYVELHTLTGGHSDTINHMAFSSDGIHLASCGDDQSLIVWNVEEGRLLYRVLFKSKVDRVLWHPTSPATIVVGCENGYLYQLHDFSPIGGEKVQIELGVRGTIQCLEYDTATRCLGVGVGCDVYMTREAGPNRYEGASMFPPPHDERMEERETRLRPINLHFLRSGEQLIASYLVHGVICWDTASQATLWSFLPHDSMSPTICVCSGSSALSPKGDSIALYNVRDGVDVYGIKSAGGNKRRPKRSYKLPKTPRTNHAIQTIYINDGRGLVCGTTTGDVWVWDTASGEVYQALAHDRDDILQAIAVRDDREYSYLAAGSVDKGQATYIKLWKAKCSQSLHRIVGYPCSCASYSPNLPDDVHK
ncbi:WD40-repeat-containing domain protein, partial [Earliella scabrosa]